LYDPSGGKCRRRQRHDQGRGRDVRGVGEGHQDAYAERGQAGRGRTHAFRVRTIVGSADGGFQILAADVTIDGFTIEGATADCSTVLSATCAGIHADNSTAGRQILNNIIQNNIIGIFLNTASTGNASLVQFNLIQNNNASPAVSGSGNGIDSETGLSNTTIDSNLFSGNVNSTMLIIGLGGPVTMITVSNNQADNSMDFGRVTNSVVTGNVFINSVASSVFIGGEDDGIAIKCNTFFQGQTRGVRINNDVFFPGTNKNITVNNNDFFGNMVTGLQVDDTAHMGAVDATNNWWGCPTGPGTGTCDTVTVVGSSTATTTPFLASSSTCAPFDDGDGVSGLVEALAPNGGDGNDDGTPDKYQRDVTSLPSATGRGYLTLETSGTCFAQNPPQNQNVQAFTAPGPGIPGDPLRFDYPFGMIGFEVPCDGTIGEKLYVHGTTSLAKFTYRKFGPSTPGVPATKQFYTLPGVVAGSQVIGGNTVATESFSLTDGALGDATGVDGLIRDPSGPGFPLRVATPTLSQWGLIALTSLILGLAFYTLRRRRGPA
jgi:hypothetical protein